MNLIRLCITRPVGVSVGVLLLVLFGLLSLLAIPVQLTPDVDIPVINVRTTWAGANPQEIEREIVDRQEEYLRSVKGLRKMTSKSLDNQAEISLEFYTGINKDVALRDVADKMRQVTGYPPEVDEPTIEASDPAIDSPIAWLILYSKSDSGIDVRSMRDFVEDNVQPYLDRVEGVASTSIFGGWEREMQVRIDAGLLAARGLTFGQVEAALRAQNANISAGTRAQGKRNYAVRTVGQYESPEEILSTVIAYTPGGPVYVRDVADVSMSFKQPTGFVRSKGRFVLGFPVRREVGANVLHVMAGLKEAVARVNHEVLRARNLEMELTQVYDETVYIDQSIAMVQNNILFGGALAVTVLMLFLRNWRATLVVALSIPISVIGTFMIVVLLGRTINVISLAGMAFAVGMVVDNAIVVLENIFRHRQTGKAAMQAAQDGAGEVWGAVLASTLTTIAVFVPVIFVEQEAGQLFRDISIATAAAVALSLVVSVTVIPTLGARLLAGRGGYGAFGGSRPQTGRFAEFVSGIVGRVNESPLARVGVILGLTFGSLWLARLLVPAATYLPAGNRNLVFGFLITPPGYSVEEFESMAYKVEEIIRPYWEAQEGTPEKRQLDQQWLERIQPMVESGAHPALHLPADYAKRSMVGRWYARLELDRRKREWLTPPPAIDNFFFVSFGGGCFMGCSSKDSARVKPLVNLLTVSGQRIPGVFAFFSQTSLFRFGGGNDLEIQVRGDDLDKVVNAASALFVACMQEFSQPRPDPTNFNLGRPEVRVVPDRERAADVGLTVRDVGLVVEAAVDGAYIGEFRVAGGDTVDISLYVKGERDRPTQEIGQVPLYTASGQIVPLRSVVQMIDTAALEQINHIERQRAVTLTVQPPETMALEEVIAKFRGEIEPRLRETGQIAPDVLISLTGNADKLVEARNTMIGEWTGSLFETLINMVASRFFLSVLIVYLLMAALFESWLYPFVIMFSVPLAVFGGFLGLRIANVGTLWTTSQSVQQLDVLTFLGFVILNGIVVNNAILLVDQALQLMRDKGFEPHAAIREAVRIRIRPVFMTSLTTIFGQLPLAFMPGAGSELYRGLAAVQLGGLLVATIGTLILVPCVLGALSDLRAMLFRGGRAVPAVSPDL